MKEANKIGSEFTIVIGDSEIDTNNALIKRMKDGKEFEISLNELEKINLDKFRN